MKIRNLNEWETEVLAEALLTLMKDRATDGGYAGETLRSRAATMLAGTRRGRYLCIEDDGTDDEPRCESCGEPWRLLNSGRVGHCGDEHGNDCPAQPT